MNKYLFTLVIFLMVSCSSLNTFSEIHLVTNSRYSSGLDHYTLIGSPDTTILYQLREHILQQLQFSIENLNDNQRNTETICAAEFLKSISKWMGVKYRYGGNTPKGIDCSGFVNHVFLDFGIKLPRSSKEIAKKGVEVLRDSVRFGDIICFKNRKGRIFHVGIMLNNNRFAHASRKGVTIGSTEDPYWKNKVATIRRFPIQGLNDIKLEYPIDYELTTEPFEND
ncbi:MAG: NlpC/P60 family protein [bacterium]|nr:NlpC/P60 family protein [bacterium]